MSSVSFKKDIGREILSCGMQQITVASNHRREEAMLKNQLDFQRIFNNYVV
jgi:hypothetical protein